MSQQDGVASSAPNAADAAAKAANASKQNPVFKMMGLPHFRLRLPSRNWMIFLTITGSWTGAVVYDRRERRSRQQKWCNLVSHLAKEPLASTDMPRKVTVFLAAPPADGLMRAREHFHEYVRPVLVASGLDWDVVEGRRQGDVRFGLAERTRAIRKRAGEKSETPLEGGSEEAIWEIRKNSGTKEWPGVQGDIVIGRHTWKEYVRGLHEGWLGPLDAPSEPPQLSSSELQSQDSTTTTSTSETDASDKPKTKAKSKQSPPYLPTIAYDTSVLSPNCPSIIGPSAALPLPHLLGFFNFPTRIYRFLTRRYTADEIGRLTAAVALGTHTSFDADASTDLDPLSAADGLTTSSPRQQSTRDAEIRSVLAYAEADWHKSIREERNSAEKEEAEAEAKSRAGEAEKSTNDEELKDGAMPQGNRAETRGARKESVWLDEIALDERIVARMRRFVLSRGDEERAAALTNGGGSASITEKE